MVAIATIGVAQNKKPLSFADYSKWNHITRANISANGQWVAYAQQPNGGDHTLFLKNLSADSLHKVNFSNAASFSEDGKWAAYMVSVSNKEAKKLRDARKELPATAVLHNLETGEKEQFENVLRFEFSADSRHFAIHRRKHADDKSRHKGTDLILKDLSDKALLNIGNVSQFSFNKKASYLAYTVDADAKVGNGLYVVALPDYSVRALDTDAELYSQLSWDDAQAKRADWGTKGFQLAVLKGTEADSITHRVNKVVVFQHLGKKEQAKKVFSSQDLAGFPAGYVMSDLGSLRWSEHGQSLFFGVKEQEATVKLSRDTIPNVDVWHWKDEMIQTVQIRRRMMLARQTFLSAIHLNTGQFIQLANDEMRNISISDHPRYAIGRNDRAYITDVNWGESPADLYRVDVVTGEKTLFANYIARPLGTSPDGRYYLYFGENHLHVYDVEKNVVTNISEKASVNFADRDHPYPNATPSYGYAGFTADRKHVVVNHHFDLWLLALDGSKAENLTAGYGDANEIRLRYVNLDPEVDYIDTKKEILLSAYGEWTKKTGYFALKAGQSPRELVYEDRNFGRPVKALNSDQVLYTIQTFTDFPDYYVSNSTFAQPKKVTNANPQQEEFAWGKRVLVNYTNSKGERLQGTLALPANYEPGKKYPMIVYFYEKMSQNHHVYSMPVYDDRPHISYYASNGYLVLQPDNVYEEGRPGTSALDCITSAVQEVIDLGYADPANIGLQGHSWGGYQSSFIVTQTDLFKCVITGAPPTNIESFYNNIYGSTGTNHHGITEIGQIRMGRNVTPWSNREAYQRENPMYHADKIKTPFMILHGTADGAVDWFQGMEFFNAARRLGKEVIFLSYPGEGHHLENEANQKDFQLRMNQYFDHYLKGTEAPDWMVNGIPNLKKLYDKAR